MRGGIIANALDCTVGCLCAFLCCASLCLIAIGYTLALPGLILVWSGRWYASGSIVEGVSFMTDHLRGD